MKTTTTRLAWIPLVLSLASSACSGAPAEPEAEAAVDAEAELRASNDKFIRKMAKDLGAAFEFEDGPYEANLAHVRLSQLDDIDPAWLAALDGKLEELNRGLSGGNAAIGDDVFQIVRNGRVIGFVLAVAFHGPAFPSPSGVRLYFNSAKRVIEQIRSIA